MPGHSLQSKQKLIAKAHFDSLYWSDYIGLHQGSKGEIGFIDRCHMPIVLAPPPAEGA